MWFWHRFKRLQSKFGHLKTYFQTLTNANEIERLTDLEQSKQLVLLLYGFGATRRSVSILEARLRNDGFDVISLKLGGLWDLFNTDPIDKVAHKMAGKIDKLCARYPLRKFTIIGYSKGGLIGRYYVSHLGGEKHVHTLITLATPHRGNPWALLSSLFMLGLFSKGVRQMLPASRFMRELEKKPIPSSVYAVSIFSHRDRACPPKYSLLPKGKNGAAVYNVALSALHHCDFVIKQSAYKIISDHLKAGLKHASKNDGPAS